MFRKHSLVEMYNLQNTLNNETNGEGWISGITKNQKEINWYRCIYMEASEAIGSYPWKHWKDIKGVIDWDNIKIEVVDIWHFLMSEHIRLVGIEKAIEEALQAYLNYKPSSTPTIELFEEIMTKALKKQLPLMDFYRTVASIEGFSMDEVYKLYLGKNCLNKFRQDHGYKDGTYIKEWGGLEDNVHMSEMLNSDPNIGYAVLYEKLEEKYNTLCA